MRFEVSIIMSVLVMTVVALPFQGGNNNELTAFGDFDVVDTKKHFMQKREDNSKKPTFEGHSSAVTDLNELYNNLMAHVNNENNDAESLRVFFQEFPGSISTTQHYLKTDIGDGAFGVPLAHIKLIFEAFKDATETKDRFEGCEYPGADIVQRSMDLRVEALAAETFEDDDEEPSDDFKKQLEDIEKRFSDLQQEATGANMVSGLRKMFEAQVEKISNAINKYKEEENHRKSLKA
ncbi:hypothetical protein OY671_007387 [Metschnikowia pulcherrima]|nr:hypothetical protein OY671_007387 [Metschnikowia pulcherrima]